VLVRRQEGGRATKSALPLQSSRELEKFPVQLGDLFEVPTIAELQKTVLLVGAISGATGGDEATAVKRLPYVEGDSVRSLVLRAGGVSPTADLAHTALVHAGGSTEDVDLEALLVRQDLRADRPVSIGDTVMVPLKRRTVIVVGAVFRPGTYPYNPRFTLPDYVAGAGGPTRFARSLEESRLMTADGQVKVFAPALAVGPGDTIVVPERDFSRPEIVQLVVAGVGLLLSGITIAITLSR
jgi:SLBB domain